MSYIDIAISANMLRIAKAAVPEICVLRTIASPIDTLVGLIGELAFAEWFMASWRLHDFLATKGKADFRDSIEIKTSAYPFRDTLNLLVRQDYAESRKPDCYVQVIINTPQKYVADLETGWICRISGWANSDEVDNAPLRDFGKKGGGNAGYLCHYIPIKNLRPMNTFPFEPVPLSLSLNT